MASNKTVFFIIGTLLIILGLFMLIPYGVQAFHEENSHSFLSSSFVTILIGSLFVLANIQREYRLNLKQTFLFSTGDIKKKSMSRRQKFNKPKAKGILQTKNCEYKRLTKFLEGKHVKA